MKAQRQSGFTLVELLISFVIVVVLLGLITEFFSSSRKTYETQSETADRQQAQLTSFGQLSYEIALAGYRGTDDDVDDRTFSGSTYEVDTGTDSDSVTVRYYEDRWLESGADPEEQEIQFSVVDDALVRTDLNHPDEPLELIDGISELRVVNYILKGQYQPHAVVDTDDVVLGLILELTFSDDTTQTLSIGFNNTQTTSSTSTN